MLFIYNVFCTAVFLLLLPLLAPLVILREKYRGRTLERLGFKGGRLKKQLLSLNGSASVVWLHALSVGEVTSALPLIKALREDMPHAVLIVSVATRGGRQIAESLLSPHVNLILYSPFDLWFAVKKYITVLQPNLFILVETDFWPCWLWSLRQKKIPTLLVNGRISKKSFTSYRRFSFFFKPMFNAFSLLSMQTKVDSNAMIRLGISPEKIITMGNLKYAMAAHPSGSTNINRSTLKITNKAKIWVCGSTHPGEEEILFAAFQQLASKIRLFLILAPRDISRAGELLALARRFHLKAATRTSSSSGGNVLILNTIGELSSCYTLAHLAFVGGSLISKGGHNPIEPAACGVPVLFGTHMEDFSEIAHELQNCGGAKTITPATLTQTASDILTNDTTRTSMARSCKALMKQHRGCTGRHLKVIRRLLRE